MFRKGQQKIFIKQCLEKLCWSNRETAIFLGISVRTLTDWKREKFLITVKTALLLSKSSGIPLSKDIPTRDEFWYVHKGARKGGLASYKKQGNKIGSTGYRSKQWRKWWQDVGRFENRPMLEQLPFKKPSVSLDLAEFFGIMMGDGGMSSRQIFITLHHTDDALYAKFVVKLIYKLFKLKASVREIPRSSVNSIVVSRTGLVSYLHSMGLPIGHKIKNGLHIPGWITNNKKFSLACLRGLVDTDGSVFTHSYKVKSRQYAYKKLSFTSASFKLLKAVYAIFRNNGFISRIYNKNSVWLDSVGEVKKYFEIVGSHNPKHWKRYRTML